VKGILTALVIVMVLGLQACSGGGLTEARARAAAEGWAASLRYDEQGRHGSGDRWTRSDYQNQLIWGILSKESPTQYSATVKFSEAWVYRIFKVDSPTPWQEVREGGHLYPITLLYKRDVNGKWFMITEGLSTGRSNQTNQGRWEVGKRYAPVASPPSPASIPYGEGGG
jgi:hypothetical protein